MSGDALTPGPLSQMERGEILVFRPFPLILVHFLDLIWSRRVYLETISRSWFDKLTVSGTKFAQG